MLTTTATAADPSVRSRPSYKWAVVCMLWFICFFNYADRQAIFAVFPVLTAEFKFDKVELGLIGSAFMWVYALGAPLAGFVGDRLRRKDLILGGCLVWSFVTVLTGRCARLWQFVTVRAIEGIGETFYMPASMSLLSDYHGRRTRSLAMSFHQSSVYLGTIGGSWLGAWLAEHYGWRAGFYFFGGAGMLLSLVLYQFLREPQRGAADADEDELATHGVPSTHPLSAKETARAICRSPIALLLMAVFLGANSVATVFLTWTPTFLVEKFNFSLSSAGFWGTASIHLASALSVPLAGMLADRLARRLAGGRIVVQAIGLLVGSAFVFLVGITPTVSTLLVAMACFGVCKGFYDSNIFASLYDYIEPRARASAAGVMNCIGWGGGALGPLIVGLIAKYGRHHDQMNNMSEAIAACGIIYLAGAAALAVAIVLSQRRNVGL